MSTLQVLSILSPLCAGAVCGYVTGIWGERRERLRDPIYAVVVRRCAVGEVV